MRAGLRVGTIADYLVMQYIIADNMLAMQGSAAESCHIREQGIILRLLFHNNKHSESIHDALIIQGQEGGVLR
ncbi:hypothetical protein D5F53_24720 [Paenibacillus lautus]|uniref:Uncharacterized protein n=1 Tax=Paenibacillus lautus TaxID=1401 RepID=A0A385TUX7_PAELA|nr:hypothetical protein D5F53_24720 [Paenibacillus lautus]